MATKSKIKKPKKPRKGLRKVYAFVWKTALLFLIASSLSVIAFRWIPVKYTPLMVQRYFENFADDNYHSRKYWEPIESISYNMILAVISSEDNNFMEHNGFEWDAIMRAREYNRHNQSGRMRGGSTITQQTAKNVFLLPSRTWVRKGLEAYFTVLIELFWSKERVMEVYLNVVEVGHGMYGVEAASRYYFGKSAKHLTVSEAAQIASILPSPRRWDIKRPSPFLVKRQNKITDGMRAINLPDIDAAR